MILYDLTLEITEEMYKIAGHNEQKVHFGHIGTHFDVMNKGFPLEYIQRTCIIFDVRGNDQREIPADEIDLTKVQRGMFAIFYTGISEKYPYGSQDYYRQSPVLSFDLIDSLIAKGISLIGVDSGGIRHGSEHVMADQLCADNMVFVIENLAGIQALPAEYRSGIRSFETIICPIRFSNLTGLPCRIVARIN